MRSKIKKILISISVFFTAMFFRFFEIHSVELQSDYAVYYEPIITPELQEPSLLEKLFPVFSIIAVPVILITGAFLFIKYKSKDNTDIDDKNTDTDNKFDNHT